MHVQGLVMDCSLHLVRIFCESVQLPLGEGGGGGGRHAEQFWSDHVQSFQIKNQLYAK